MSGTSSSGTPNPAFDITKVGHATRLVKGGNYQGGRNARLVCKLRAALLPDVDKYVKRLKQLALGKDNKLALDAIKEILNRIYGRAPLFDPNAVPNSGGIPQMRDLFVTIFEEYISGVAAGNIQNPTSVASEFISVDGVRDGEKGCAASVGAGSLERSAGSAERLPGPMGAVALQKHDNNRESVDSGHLEIPRAWGGWDGVLHSDILAFQADSERIPAGDQDGAGNE